MNAEYTYKGSLSIYRFIVAQKQIETSLYAFYASTGVKFAAVTVTT